MLPIGTKVVYTGGDPHVRGIVAGDTGYVVDSEPLMNDDSTIVVEFKHPEYDGMYIQEVQLRCIESVDT